MLVLSRKTNESLVIDGNIRVTVLGIRGNHVRIGIEAPGQVPIYREELISLGQADPTDRAPWQVEHRSDQPVGAGC